MKMSKEQFGMINDSINKLMSKYSPATIVEHRENIKSVKNQFVSFCWFMFRASGFDCKKLYDAGLSDSHIETALKHILSDFD